MNINNPSIGSAILADRSNKDETQKVNINGAFTTFWAWGFPCFRKWTATVTLFNLPKGKTSMKAYLNGPSIKNIIIAGGGIETKYEDTNFIMQFDLEYMFKKPGKYFIDFRYDDFDDSLTVPFEIREKNWAKFTRSEIKFVRKHKNIPDNIEVDIQCKKCDSMYTFVEAIGPEIYLRMPEARQFPLDGSFPCDKCNNIIDLKDIQGQVRETLKGMIISAMRGR